MIKLSVHTNASLHGLEMIKEGNENAAFVFYDFTFLSRVSVPSRCSHRAHGGTMTSS